MMDMELVNVIDVESELKFIVDECHEVIRKTTSYQGKCAAMEKIMNACNMQLNINREAQLMTVRSLQPKILWGNEEEEEE